MARAHFVKKARKDIPGTDIKAGDSYYWWAFRVGGRGTGKRYSKTPPKRSQLTQSAFYAALYDLQDDVAAITAQDADQLSSDRDSIVERLNELGSEQQEKLDNMPEGLQQGPTGETLQERIDWCEQQASEFEQIDFDDFEEEDFDVEDAEAEAEEDDSNESDEDRQAAVEEARSKHEERQKERRQEWLEEKLQEMNDIDLSSPN